MFTGWSIRRRLVVIAVGVSVAILAVVAALTLNSTTPVIAAQTESALIARNRTLASTLDSEIRALSATAETLAASVGNGSPRDVQTLWAHATSVMAGDSPVRRIGAVLPFRDDYRAIIFTRSSVEGAAPALSRLYGTIPNAEWFDAALVAGGARWFGPHPAYQSPGGNEVVTITAPVTRRGEETVGLLWVDIPIGAVRTQMDALFRSEQADERFGYNLLVDANGSIISGFNLPIVAQENALETLRAREDVANLISSVEMDADGLLASSDPMSGGANAYVIRSLVPGNGWSVVSVLPTDLFQNPLVRSTFQIIVVALIGIFVLGILLYQFAKASVSEPLTALSTAAQEIGSGDMRYHIDYRERRDEIGKLAAALEDMKVNLARSYEELSLWSRRLEKRVQERTVELEAAQREAQFHAAELQAVYDASLAIVSEYYLKVMLQTLAERAETLLRASYVSVWLMTDDGRQIQMVATTSEDRSHLEEARDLNTGIAAQSVREQQPIRIDDYRNWSQRIGWIDESVYHALSVPLLLSQQPVGAIVVGRGEDDPIFTANDEQVLALLANLASPMVRNAQLYAQVDAAQKQAESANRVKTRFLASVTHELRTPLNLIINNMDFMRVGMFGDVNDEQRGRLDQTIRSAEHLLYLINDLLDVSKIEAGEMQMFFQPTELQPVLEDTIDSTLALMDGSKPVSLQTDIPADLPYVTMDARRIRQVLTNLLSNAVKFTQEGDVWLRVRVLRGAVEFTVSDTGIGIPQEDIDLIFEAFERSKPSKEKGIEGTGLGLPISRYLVEAHGGSMTVHSKVGEGSTFTVRLPLQPPQAEEAMPYKAAFIGEGD